MSLIAGSIQVELEALDKGFNKSFDNAQKSLKKFENDAENSTKKIKDLSNNLLTGLGEMAKGVGLAVGVGLTAFAGYGAKLAIDYEKQLSGIKALTGATADEMAQISKLAVKLGNDTKYSSIEAAKGAEELLKAGVSLEQVMGGGLAGALDLAAAGELEVADAAEIASTALNAFKKDGLSVSNAADILAGAANASATSVQELKFGLSQTAAVASGVGLTFKDTSTALAVFAQNGLKGSDAGTSLKTMLLNLQPTTDAQIGKFIDLGLMTEETGNQFFDAEGKIKSLSEISGLLNEKLGDLTDQQRLATLETLFGSDAIRAANILYKEGADGIKKMSKEMTKFTAQDVARERTNNLAGALERFKGTLDTKAIELFSGKLPSATSAIEGLNSAIQAIDIEKLDGMITNFFKWISDNYIFVVSGLTGIASVLTVMMVPALVASATATWGLLAPLLPMAGIIFGIVTALTALVLFIDANWATIANTTQQVFDNIKNWISETWTFVTVQTTNFLNWASLKIIETWNWISSETTKVWEGIKSFFAGIWSGIETIVATAFLTIYGLFTGNGELLKQIWEPIWNGISKFFSDIWAGIENKAKETWNWMTSSLDRFGKDSQKSWNDTMTSITTRITEFFTWFVTEAPKKWTEFNNGVAKFGTEVWAGMDKAMNDMGARIWEALTWIMNLDMGKIGRDMIQGMINGVSEMGNNLKNSIGDAVNNAVKAAKDKLGIQSPSKVFYEIGGFTMEGMQNGISENIDMPVSAINTATTATINQSLDQVVTQTPQAPQQGNMSVTINGNYLGSERDKRNLAKDLKDAFNQVILNNA